MDEKKPKSLRDAIRYFGNEDNCIRTVAEMRWPNGIVCPACGHKEHYYLENQRRWKCKECWKQFSAKVGSIFEDSPIPLDKWLIALWMLVNCKNGISSYEVARDLGITQKSAWFVLHRLRLALQEGSIDNKIGGDGGEVEADEAFIGGKPKNMHKSRRLALNQAKNECLRGNTRLIGKTAVMGLLDRQQRKVRATVVPDVKRDTLQNEILKQVERGTQIYTDESTSYMGLTAKYAHQVVNHMEQYVNGRVHTNGLENFWSLLKRGLNGTYVAVEPYHLFRYVDEQVFRYNNRKQGQYRITDLDRFNLALSQIAGKRLTYKEVTGKVGETTV
ncbi:MAG TPA: IS1595 family transposase [Terriglobales bacterium]|nr:IS1595 family transposase [Terriglobales bacterium]